MKTGSCKRAYGACEAELDQFSISGTKMFQMVWIRRRDDLAGFRGPVGLVDEMEIGDLENVDRYSEDAAQEGRSRENRRKADDKPHALSCSGGCFTDKKGQEGIGFTYNRHHQALLTSPRKSILRRSIGKRPIEKNRLLNVAVGVQRIGIVCAPPIHTIERRKLVNRIPKPDVPPPRDIEPLEGLGHGFIMIAVGICCFAAVAAIFLLIV